jgi:hypothetical protein
VLFEIAAAADLVSRRPIGLLYDDTFLAMITYVTDTLQAKVPPLGIVHVVFISQDYSYFFHSRVSLMLTPAHEWEMRFPKVGLHRGDYQGPGLFFISAQKKPVSALPRAN